MKKSHRFCAIYATVCILIFIQGSITPAYGVLLSTADNQFIAGTDNQGWWSPTLTNSSSNDNYFLGISFVASADHRNFFTFNLSSLNSPISSATLMLTRGGSYSGNELTEVIEFFDVTTDAAALNNNTAPNAAIFNDLGSGASYGQFVVQGSGDTTSVLSFSLNSSAVQDMNHTSGFFSVGGVLTSNDGDDALFDSSHHYTALLEVTTVPLPAGLWLFGSGLLGLIGMARKKRYPYNNEARI